MFAITENTIKRLSSAPRSVGGSNEERDLWSCACGVFARSLSRKLKERFDFTPHEIECAVVLLCGPERYSDYLEIRHKRASLSPTYAAYNIRILRSCTPTGTGSTSRSGPPKTVSVPTRKLGMGWWL